MNKLKKRILSAITAAAVAFGSIGVLPETGFLPELSVPAAAAGEPGGTETGEITLPTPGDPTSKDSITYIDENGEKATVSKSDYTIITSDTTLWSGTMVVPEDTSVTINGQVDLKANTNLILCDGCELTISNVSADSDGGYGIGADAETFFYSDPDQYPNLSVYAQQGETGKLNVSADFTISSINTVSFYGGNINLSSGTFMAESECDGFCIYAFSDVIIAGGNITLTGAEVFSQDPQPAIHSNGNITITGGNVVVNDPDGIYADNTISLGWTNPTDSIKVDSYNGTVNFTKPFVIESGDIAYWNTIEDNNIAGETLTPAYAVTFMDGETTLSTVGVAATGTATVTKPDDPTKEGYVFAGWYTNPQFTGDPFDFTTAITEDTTLYARFTNFSDLQSLINATAANGTLVLDCDYKALSTEGYITIPEGKTMTIDLNGHTIDRGLTSKTGGGNVITVNGNLTLTDTSTGGTITGGKTTGEGGGVFVSEDGTFTMSGGTITGNTASRGGGVYADGTFTMNGGTISENTAENPGGGVYADGTFTMNGGTISGNTAGIEGGGVFVYDGTFTMTGGTISGNTANISSGGVCVYNGTFTMTGGTISGNTANGNGGGAFVWSDGKFYLKNGVTVSDEVVVEGTIKHFGTVTITENTGGTVTATAADEDKLTVGETTYYVEGGDVTLTVEPASGYALSSLTVKDADNNDITVTNDQFTMPAANVTVTAEFEEIPGTVSVTYIGADGNTATTTDYTVLTSQTDISGTLPAGWYVVTDTVNYASTLNFVPSDVHIILCDGASLNIGTADNHVETCGIACFHSDELKGHLSVYGQSGGTGALNIYSTGHSINTKTGFTLNGGKLTTISSYGYGVWSNGGITINGGKLTTTTTGSLRARADLTINGGTIDAGDIYAEGNITINGGTIDAGNIYAGEDFYNPKTITLGWTNPTDSIKAASFEAKYVTFAKPFVIENGTLATEDNIAGHTLTPAKYAVAVTPVDTSGNAVAVQGSWLDSYPYGTSVTLTAPAAEGYNFVGWYAYSTTSPYYTGDALSTNNVYTFTITAVTSLAAVYQPLGKVSLTIDGGSSFTINGDAKSTSITADYMLGTTITAATNTAKFAYWKNSYGMVLSRSASYTFTVTGADTITAVFDTVVENKATLVFESAYGQVMAREQLAEGGSMEIPSLPYRNGYTALGWDLNGDGEYDAVTDTLAAAIAKGLAEDSKVWKILPVYTLNTTTYTITVTGGTITQGTPDGEGKYAQNAKITVTANEPESGQKFSHWTDGTSILGYNTSYQFFADRNLALTAVFVADTAVVEAVGTTEIISTSIDTENKKMTFVSLSSVPEGCTIKMAGLIFTLDADLATTDNGSGFTDSTAVMVRGESWSGTSFRYTWTITGVKAGKTVYARAYLVYTDTNGNSHTVYGGVESLTL